MLEVHELSFCTFEASLIIAYLGIVIIVTINVVTTIILIIIIVKISHVVAV